MILCEIILIHAFRWHIKRSQRNRSQQQLEEYNIDVFVKYILLWSWIWFLPVSYSALLADDLKLAGGFGYSIDAKASVAHISWHFLTCLVTNSSTTPIHLNKNDRVSFDQKIIRRSVFWVQRTVRTTTKSNQFQTSAKTRHVRDLQTWEQQAWDLFEKLSLNLWKYQNAHHWSVLFWSLWMNLKQFYLCLWLDKCSSLETKGRGLSMWNRKSLRNFWHPLHSGCKREQAFVPVHHFYIITGWQANHQPFSTQLTEFHHHHFEKTLPEMKMFTISADFLHHSDLLLLFTSCAPGCIFCSQQLSWDAMSTDWWILRRLSFPASLR